MEFGNVSSHPRRSTRLKDKPVNYSIKLLHYVHLACDVGEELDECEDCDSYELIMEKKRKKPEKRVCQKPKNVYQFMQPSINSKHKCCQFRPCWSNAANTASRR